MVNHEGGHGFHRSERIYFLDRGRPPASQRTDGGPGGEGENKNEKQGGAKGAQPPDEARVEVRTMKSK